MIKKRCLVMFLMLLLVTMAGCAQAPKGTKRLIPDQTGQPSPTEQLPPQQEPSNEVVEEIDTYEGSDIDVQEFDDLTDGFDGL